MSIPEVIMNFMDTVDLKLNPYQASNLLWFLKRCWIYTEEFKHLQPPNNGDWVGEIPQILEKLMKEAGGYFLTTQPNGSFGRDAFQNPEWITIPPADSSGYSTGKYVWPCDHNFPKKVESNHKVSPAVYSCECGMSSTDYGRTWNKTYTIRE